MKLLSLTCFINEKFEYEKKPPLPILRIHFKLKGQIVLEIRKFYGRENYVKGLEKVRGRDSIQIIYTQARNQHLKNNLSHW